jgi:hypothetical protein
MESFEHLIRTIFALLLDILTFTHLCLRPTIAVAAENLFLRKQLGLFVERKIKPRRLPILSGSLSPDSPAGLIGETP